MDTERDEFTQQVRDALAHLYDFAYLQTHPLVSLLVDGELASQQTRGQELRKVLLQAIGALNPGPNVPFRSPERRGYVSLFCRYVEGQSPTEIARSLAISERQLRRDHGQALEAVVSILWNQYLERREGLAEEAQGDGALRREVSRVMSWEEIELRETVEGVLSAVAGLAQQKGVNLRSEIPEGLPSLYASRTLVRQILFNILGRVLERVPGGEVVLQAHLQKNSIAIEVIIRSPRRQAETPRAVLLGEDLSIAFQFVESLGGRMWLEKTPDHGVTVRFTLPAASEAVVLAIDDNETLFRLFERYLARHRYRLIGVRDGDEGVKLAQELQPEAITLDVMMPDRDGWEVLQTLCTDPLTRDIPVIVCTVLDEPELAYSLGAQAYLKKPIGRADLLAALDQVLNKT